MTQKHTVDLGNCSLDAEICDILNHSQSGSRHKLFLIEPFYATDYMEESINLP